MKLKTQNSKGKTKRKTEGKTEGKTERGNSDVLRSF
jgi:hypothetical protein